MLLNQNSVTLDQTHYATRYNTQNEIISKAKDAIPTVRTNKFTSSLFTISKDLAAENTNRLRVDKLQNKIHDDRFEDLSTKSIALQKEADVRFENIKEALLTGKMGTKDLHYIELFKRLQRQVQIMNNNMGFGGPGFNNNYGPDVQQRERQNRQQRTGRRGRQLRLPPPPSNPSSGIRPPTSPLNNISQTIRSSANSASPGAGTFLKGAGRALLPVALITSGIAGYSALASGDYEGASGAAGGLVGGLAGGKAGSVAGAALGTLLLPGIGTAIGGIVGGLAGGILGYMGGTEAGKSIFSFFQSSKPPKDSRTPPPAKTAWGGGQQGRGVGGVPSISLSQGNFNWDNKDGLDKDMVSASALKEYANINSGVDVGGLNSELKTRFASAARDYYLTTGRKVTVTSGLRSDKKQAELYARYHYLHDPTVHGAAKPKTAQTVTIQGRTFKVPGGGKGSNHLTGMAIDVSKNTGDASTFRPFAEKYGLRQMYPIADPVHYEMADGRAPLPDGTNMENVSKNPTVPPLPTVTASSGSPTVSPTPTQQTSGASADSQVLSDTTTNKEAGVSVAQTDAPVQDNPTIKDTNNITPTKPILEQKTQQAAGTTYSTNTSASTTPSPKINVKVVSPMVDLPTHINDPSLQAFIIDPLSPMEG